MLGDMTTQRMEKNWTSQFWSSTEGGSCPFLLVVYWRLHPGLGIKMCGSEVSSLRLPTEGSRKTELFSQGPSLPKVSAWDGVPHQQGLWVFHKPPEITDDELQQHWRPTIKRWQPCQGKSRRRRFFLCLLMVSTLKGNYKKHRKSNIVQKREYYVPLFIPKTKQS